MGFDLTGADAIAQAADNIPEKSIRALHTLARFNRPIATLIQNEVAEGMTSLARSKMLEKLSQSGVQRISGDLERAVGNCEVIQTKNGYRIRLKSGYSQDVYIRASVFKYGSLRGAGGLSKRSRKSIKGAAKKGLVKGVSYQSPKKPFFSLSPSEDAQFATRQEQLLRDAFARRGVQ